MATPPIYASRKSIGGVALYAWKNPQDKVRRIMEHKGTEKDRGMGKEVVGGGVIGRLGN